MMIEKTQLHSKRSKFKWYWTMFLPGSNTGRVSATTKEKDLTRMEKTNAQTTVIKTTMVIN